MNAANLTDRAGAADLDRGVTGYLACNSDLRAAVGAGEGVVLVPHALGEGEHNLNYWFAEPTGGRKFVLRVNVASQPFHDNQVAYEFAALKALAPSGCTPQPVYLDDSAGALGKGVIVESFCQGAELDFDNLQPGDVEYAVQIMADVHAVPVGADCPLHRPRDPLHELFEECLERFKIYRSSECEDARITRWVERFIGDAQDLMSETTCRPADREHIINTETLPSHFLVPKRDSNFGDADKVGECSAGVAGSCKAGNTGSRVGGDAGSRVGGDAGSRMSSCRGAFIDWERPIIGEPAQDVAYFTAPTTTFWDSDFMFPADRVEEVVESYWAAVGGRFERGNFDERFRAYRAMTALRSATWCCRALVQYSRDATHKTQRTIDKLPIYLSDTFMSRIASDCF